METDDKRDTLEVCYLRVQVHELSSPLYRTDEESLLCVQLNGNSMQAFSIKWHVVLY